MGPAVSVLYTCTAFILWWDFLTVNISVPALTLTVSLCHCRVVLVRRESRDLLELLASRFESTTFLFKISSLVQVCWRKQYIVLNPSDHRTMHSFYCKHFYRHFLTSLSLGADVVAWCFQGLPGPAGPAGEAGKAGDRVNTTQNPLSSHTTYSQSKKNCTSSTASLMITLMSQ